MMRVGHASKYDMTGLEGAQRPRRLQDHECLKIHAYIYIHTYVYTYICTYIYICLM